MIMDLFGKSLIELQELIKTKKVSSKEVFDYFAKRSKKYNPKLNAFHTLLDKPVTESSATGGSLYGIPFSMKDTYNTKGVQTTASSRVIDDYIPPYNATVYERLVKAGAVILGKSNCDAWGHGSSTENSDFGVTKNPWNNDYVAGGSSGGSAAALSAYLSPFEIGEDTCGSIRLPAAFCGVVGLKVTYGLVSRYGCIAYASSLDTVGPMTTSVHDMAAILEIIAGNDPYDATSTFTKSFSYLNTLDRKVSGLKIGVPKEYFGEGIDPEVERKTKEALGIFEKLGATVKEISLPHTKYAIAAYYLLVTSETSSNLARYDGIRFGNDRNFFAAEAKRRLMLGGYTLSAGYYDQYYKKAQKVRTIFREDFDDAFKDVDLIIAPVSPIPAFKIVEKINNPLQMYLSDIHTVPVNLTGIPSLSVPIGLSKEGLPIGMQIMGNHFQEDKILNVGYQFEQETNFFDVIKKGREKYKD